MGNVGESRSDRIDAGEGGTDRAIAASWDAEYRSGRYIGEPPLPFVDDIVAAARAHGLAPGCGLYVGCGNGRNYLPLVASGLDLVGLDLSSVAIAQLTHRASERTDRLVCGNISALPAGARYPIVIAIQVLQHGDEVTSHRGVQAAKELVAPGGLLCVRVNAVGSEVDYEHDVEERGDDGRCTIRYRAGPKRGLAVHFFSAPELRGLLQDGFEPVLPLRRSVTHRATPQQGSWSQWEGIWRREPARPR